MYGSGWFDQTFQNTQRYISVDDLEIWTSTTVISANDHTRHHFWFELTRGKRSQIHSRVGQEPTTFSVSSAIYEFQFGSGASLYQYTLKVRDLRFQHSTWQQKYWTCSMMITIFFLQVNVTSQFPTSRTDQRGDQLPGSGYLDF